MTLGLGLMPTIWSTTMRICRRWRPVVLIYIYIIIYIYIYICYITYKAKKGQAAKGLSRNAGHLLYMFILYRCTSQDICTPASYGRKYKWVNSSSHDGFFLSWHQWASWAAASFRSWRRAFFASLVHGACCVSPCKHEKLCTPHLWKRDLHGWTIFGFARGPMGFGES